LFFIVYIDYIYVLYGPGGLRWAATNAQTTPDASFWPMVRFFFVVYYYYFDTNLFFNVYIGYIYVVYAPGGLRWAAMKAQTTHLASFGP
jgi:hypothetical protein